MEHNSQRQFESSPMHAHFTQASVTSSMNSQMMSSPPMGVHSMQHQASKPQADLKPNFYNPYHVKHRRRTTKEQLTLLEGTFKSTPKPSSELRKSLASTLGMTAREVQIWFQNRRAKQKNMLMRACSSNASPELCADKDASAEASCVQSPVDDVLSASSKLTRACSADHSQQHAASTRPPLASALCSSSSSLGSSVREMMAPTLALRRHSDIPAHFFHSETSAYAAAVAATASAGAMLPAVSTVNRSATIPSSIAATAASSECAASLQMSTAAYPSQIPPPLTNVSSSDMLQRAAYSHVPSSRPIQLVPSQQQKKQKRAGNGDSDRYHTARVHQEAFDGTNKLPVKYDDFLKRTADEQFNLLDPANLPNFMIPTVPGNGLGALGSGMSSVGFSSQPPMPYGGMGWPAMPYSGCGNSQSHPSMHSAMPQPDMSMLFSGLLALSPNGGGGSGHSYPSMLNAPFGLSGMGSGLGTGTAAPAAHPGMSPADMPFGVDSSSSFYHTLLLLAHQNPNLAGNSSAQRQGAAQQNQHQPQSNSSGHLQVSKALPLSPSETLPSGSPPIASHSQQQQHVVMCDSSSSALVSPITPSAFSPYEARNQTNKHGAMFMPTSVSSFPLLVSTAMAASASAHDGSSSMLGVPSNTTADVFTASSK